MLFRSWKVSPIINHLFTSVNRFGINVFSTVFDDGKVNWNIHGRPSIFSKFQLKKLQQHPSQVLIFNNSLALMNIHSNVNLSNFFDIFYAIQYFFLIQNLLQSSKIHCLVDSVMCFLQFRCTNFYFAKDQQLRIHDKYIQEQKDAKTKAAKFQKLMERYL